MYKTAIDLFAGLGGFTEGAEMAGVRVKWAGNHNPLAVKTHHLNHPGTTHVCQDLHQANWSTIPKVDMVLASPCCQGHSNAKGKEQSHHDESRSTAWAVVSCCETLDPQSFIVENVPEFLRWNLFPAWSMAMEALGYTMTKTVIDAADLGVPQHRKRLFIVGNKSGAIHIDQPSESHTPIRNVIDWEYDKWSNIRDKVAKTQSRWESGRKKFGERFIMPFYGSGSGKTGRSLDRPVGTVTCVDRWAVVRGEQVRMMQPHELQRAMGFGDHYRIDGTKREKVRMIGNAVCPQVAKYVVDCVKVAS